MLSKTMKKRISTPNFETSSHQNVTAKKPIGNMYFMYVDMAWFHSLSRLEHDMLHSTVWPVHKICPMPVCWRPNPNLTKRMLFCLSFPECYPYNRNLRFLLNIYRYLLSTVLSYHRPFGKKNKTNVYKEMFFPHFLKREGHSSHCRAFSHTGWRAVDCAVWVFA